MTGTMKGPWRSSFQRAIEAACEAARHALDIPGGCHLQVESASDMVIAAIRAIPEPPAPGENELAALDESVEQLIVGCLQDDAQNQNVLDCLPSLSRSIVDRVRSHDKREADEVREVLRAVWCSPEGTDADGEIVTVGLATSNRDFDLYSRVEAMLKDGGR